MIQLTRRQLLNEEIQQIENFTLLKTG